MSLKKIILQIFLPYDSNLNFYWQYLQLMSQKHNRKNVTKIIYFLLAILYSSTIRTFTFGLLNTKLFDETARFKNVDFVYILLGRRLIPGTHLCAGILGFLGAHFLFVTCITVPNSFLIHLKKVFFIIDKPMLKKKRISVINMFIKKKKTSPQVALLAVNSTKFFLIFIGWYLKITFLFF